MGAKLSAGRGGVISSRDSGTSGRFFFTEPIIYARFREVMMMMKGFISKERSRALHQFFQRLSQ